MQLDNSQTPFENLGTKSQLEVRFRCPCCEKLYQTQADVFDESEPEFDCENCGKSFVLLKSMNSFGLHEAKSDQYQLMAQAESPVLYELNQLWAQVVGQFGDDLAHQEFLNQCQQKTALSFAFQKYDELRKTMNYDSVCEKYLKQIELRLEQQLLAKHAPPAKAKKSFRIKMQFTQWVFAIIGFVGLSLLVFNKIRPTFPNLTGLVVSITVLSFGLWLLSSQNSDKNIKL